MRALQSSSQSSWIEGMEKWNERIENVGDAIDWKGYVEGCPVSNHLQFV